MTFTVEQIKKLLEGITPGEWEKCYDGSSDWTIGESPDPQAKPICHVWSKNDKWANAHCDFIAAAPSIVRFLLEKVENLERQGIADMKEVTELSERVKNLELFYRAAKEGWILRVLKDESQMKMTRELAKKWVDQTIQSEVERLKDNG